VAPVGDLPKLGDCWHMDSVDKIVHLRPSLVIGSVPYKPETVAKLLSQPFAFLAMNPRTLADIEMDTRLLGGITGRATAAERLVQKMRRAFSQIQRKSRRIKQPIRVYCEAWPNPRISSPPWVAELVQFCGGEVVVAPGEKVTDTQVAAARPEVMVLAWAATGAKADPKRSYRVHEWRELPAIRNRQVHVVRDDLLNTPGPPLIEGVRELWKVLHSVRDGGQQKSARR
jgi:iron complex transport system substrate-binding protein